MLLSNLIGSGEPLERIVHDKDVSYNFIKYLLLGFLPVAANLIVPGIYGRLLRGVIEFDDFVNDLKENNSQLLGLIILIIFTWLGVGFYLGEIGYNTNYGNSFLVNVSLVIFLSLICLLGVYLFHFIFFEQNSVLNFHTVDFVLFQILIGSIIYVCLAVEWFSSQNMQINIRPILLIIIIFLIVFRVVRLTFFLRSAYTQSAYLIFYYLCAIEIAPYLIIGKILSNLK